MRVKKIEPIVKDVLTDYREARDNDQILIALVCQRVDYEATKADFMTAMVSGRLQNFETITRARRKVQEKYAELRGKTYAERHLKEAEYEAYNREELE